MPTAWKAAPATLNGNPDPSAVQALIVGTLLIYNGSIAFAMTGLFLAAAAWATFDSGVMPRWTGWMAVAGAVLCAASVPAMYGGPVDYTGFYNAGGWGPGWRGFPSLSCHTSFVWHMTGASA